MRHAVLETAPTGWVTLSRGPGLGQSSPMAARSRLFFMTKSVPKGTMWPALARQGEQGSRGPGTRPRWLL